MRVQNRGTVRIGVQVLVMGHRIERCVLKSSTSAGPKSDTFSRSGHVVRGVSRNRRIQWCSTPLPAQYACPSTQSDAGAGAFHPASNLYRHSRFRSLPHASSASSSVRRSNATVLREESDRGGVRSWTSQSQAEQRPSHQHVPLHFSALHGMIVCAAVVGQTVRYGEKGTSDGVLFRTDHSISAAMRKTTSMRPSSSTTSFIAPWMLSKRKV